MLSCWFDYVLNYVQSSFWFPGPDTPSQSRVDAKVGYSRCRRVQETVTLYPFYKYLLTLTLQHSYFNRIHRLNKFTIIFFIFYSPVLYSTIHFLSSSPGKLYLSIEEISWIIVICKGLKLLWEL